MKRRSEEENENEKGKGKGKGKGSSFVVTSLLLCRTPGLQVVCPKETNPGNGKNFEWNDRYMLLLDTY